MQPSFLTIELTDYDRFLKGFKEKEQLGATSVFAPQGITNFNDLHFCKNLKEVMEFYNKHPEINNEFQLFDVHELHGLLREIRLGNLDVGEYIFPSSGNSHIMQLGDFAERAQIVDDIDAALQRKHGRSIFQDNILSSTDVERKERMLAIFERLCRYPSGQIEAKELWDLHLAHVPAPPFLSVDILLDQKRTPAEVRDLIAHYNSRKIVNQLRYQQRRKPK